MFLTTPWSKAAHRIISEGNNDHKGEVQDNFSEKNRRSRFITLNTRNLGRYFLTQRRGERRGSQRVFWDFFIWFWNLFLKKYMFIYVH